MSDAVVILDGGVVVAGGSMTELRKGSDELAVEVDGPDAAGVLVGALHGAGIAASTPRDGVVVVALERPIVFDIVRDLVAENGLGLRRLQARRASLEDVFLGASGGGEPAPGSAARP